MKSFKTFLKEQANIESDLVRVFAQFILKHKIDSMIATSECLKHLKNIVEKDYDDETLKAFLSNPTSLIIAVTHHALFQNKGISAKHGALSAIVAFSDHLETALDEYKEIYLTKDAV